MGEKNSRIKQMFSKLFPTEFIFGLSEKTANLSLILHSLSYQTVTMMNTYVRVPVNVFRPDGFVMIS